MRNDPRADKLHVQVQKYEESEPLKAIQLLKEIVRDYKNTFTVHNYVIPDILRISKSNQLWEEAIEICELSQRLYPDEKVWYALEIQACQLERENKLFEATEIRFQQDTLHGKGSGIYRIYGDSFAQIGAHDRAWSLYNEAIALSAKEAYSPHKIRQSMAKLLVKENRLTQAVEILIFGICEAEKLNKGGAPKSITNDIKKVLKVMGLKNPSLADEITTMCKTHGRETTIEFFHSQVHS